MFKKKQTHLFAHTVELILCWKMEFFRSFFIEYHLLKLVGVVNKVFMHEVLKCPLSSFAYARPVYPSRVCANSGGHVLTKRFDFITLKRSLKASS